MMAKTTFHEKISREISKVPDPSALRSYGHHESGRTETESFQSKAARPQEACHLCKDHPGRRLAPRRKRKMPPCWRTTGLPNRWPNMTRNPINTQAMRGTG